LGKKNKKEGKGYILLYIFEERTKPFGDHMKVKG
jgi:hypothetical protein